MLDDRTERDTTARQGHSDSWSHIAADAWLPSKDRVQISEVVVKPIEIGGQVIHFPVTICPPGTAAGIEKPIPRPFVSGGSCSPR